MIKRRKVTAEVFMDIVEERLAALGAAIPDILLPGPGVNL
jgi:hypothetical protein